MLTVEHQTSAAFTFTGIARAGVIAALLAFVSPVAASAEPISCGYGESGYPPNCGWSSGEGSETATFDWDDYFFELTLYGVSGFGDITITDNPMSESDFQSKLEDEVIIDFEEITTFAHTPTPHAGSYVCIPMVEPNGADPLDAPCRDFAIVADDTLSWENYAFKIDWNWDSHNNGYDGSDGRARVLRDHSNDGYGFYDEDMCIQAELVGGNYVPCEYSPFPFIISGDTDFSTVTPALALVPEPAAMALLGSGVIALWHRRRSARSL